MAINNKSGASKKAAGKKAGSSKKTDFFSCSGCFGMYPVGTGIFPPPNKYNFKQVCKSCYNQYIGTSNPVPAVSSKVLKNQFGSLMTSGGAGILSNANAGLISERGGAILSNANAGLISDKSGGFISDQGGGFKIR